MVTVAVVVVVFGAGGEAFIAPGGVEVPMFAAAAVPVPLSAWWVGDVGCPPSTSSPSAPHSIPSRPSPPWSSTTTLVCAFPIFWRCSVPSSMLLSCCWSAFLLCPVLCAVLSVLSGRSDTDQPAPVYCVVSSPHRICVACSSACRASASSIRLCDSVWGRPQGSAVSFPSSWAS